jgi:hypothetical protein
MGVPPGRETPAYRRLYACVLAALAQSDFEAAYRHATKISPAGQLASHEPYALWVMLDLVEAALRTDRADEASAHVHAMQVAGVATVGAHLYRVFPKLGVTSRAALRDALLHQPAELPLGSQTLDERPAL